MAAALGASLDLWVRWRGAELDRIINAVHSALHEGLARMFASLPAWQAFPEVSFSYYGERGVIDRLGWHPATRSLLIVEIKTAIVDVQALLGRVDRYIRLARQIARDRGWQPATISLWLVMPDVSRNRRAVAAHQVLFDRVFAADGRAMRSWLRMPAGQIRALSFLSHGRGVAVRPKRVRLGAVPAKRPRTNPAFDQLGQTVPPV